MPLGTRKLTKSGFKPCWPAPFYDCTDFAAGRVIGKGGRRINTITDVSGAQITVSKATGKNSDRTVTIRGLPKSVTKAQNMISAALQSNVSIGVEQLGNCLEIVGGIVVK